MKTTIKLFASLREGRFDSHPCELAEGATVQDALDSANISAAEAAILFLNGRHTQPEHLLTDGDSLAIFPPVGGG
ncbi:MAG: molybdopterin synthase sulfur carrier subunit [Spirochaetes bacterium RIFOXYC1_FULL_54_7]|nr:MAG: molybdopterin synthase sulfur carrier subunit [Spirochaetes bacterium RIFOXYC1_FULL_54_7]